MPDPDLHDEPPPGSKAAWRLLHKDAIGIESVLTSAESEARFVVAHLGHEPRHLPLRDIGRIRNDHVEGPFRQCGEIPLHKPDTLFDAVGPRSYNFV